jgi:mannose/fructose/N-acetylgalactosamine-specific phosphotransferase system component IIB
MNLIRVDDRLIHGQVAVGWCGYIDPVYMIIADNEIASDRNDSELYLTGVPFECVGKALTIVEAAEFVNSIRNEPYILVVKSLKDALDLFNAGCRYGSLNLGGIHYAEGKKEIVSYIYLDKHDIDLIKEITASGAGIFVQDLPSNPEYGVDFILNKWKNQ